MRPTYINRRPSKFNSKKTFNSGLKNNSIKNNRFNDSKKAAFNFSSNSVLQFLTLTVITSFGILLIPNLLTENTPKANAATPKRVQLISNFSNQDTATKTVQTSQLIEVQEKPVETSSSSQSSSKKIIANPNFAANSSKTYKTLKGDTLASIATKLNIDPVELAIINGLKNSKVEVGVELKLP